MTNTELDLSGDVIDVRDIIERVEFLDPEFSDTQLTTAEQEELQALKAILEDLAGNGGDEQWQGDWYPVTLIRDSYFEQHARDLAEDCGLTDKPMGWPYNCIDWEYAARELKYDYSSTTIDGITYWFR